MNQKQKAHVAMSVLGCQYCSARTETEKHVEDPVKGLVSELEINFCREICARRFQRELDYMDVEEQYDYAA